MPRFYPNTLISDCWSSVGNVTFYHRNGKCYWRNNSSLQFAGTASQIQALDVHKRALAAWRGISDDDKELWNECAKPVLSHRPPFGVDGRISGYNLFVSAYHGFAVLGSERVPKPCAWEGFPQFVLSFKEVLSVDEGLLGLRFILEIKGNSEPSRYRLLCKVQTGAEGAGVNPGLMRNCLSPSIPDKETSNMELFIPYSELSPVQIHMRYLLIDSVSGYRSQYHKLSFVCLVK